MTTEGKGMPNSWQDEFQGVPGRREQLDQILTNDPEHVIVIVILTALILTRNHGRRAASSEPQ